MTEQKPWCGRPLPDDRDGWKTRAMAFREHAIEADERIDALRTDLAAANEREARLWTALRNSTNHLEIMLNADDRLGPTIIAHNRWLLEHMVPEATAATGEYDPAGPDNEDEEGD